MLDRIWTISNILSFSRVLLLAPISYFLLVDVPNNRAWAAFFMILAAATDFLDGYLARVLHQVTDLGKIIDPVADKITVGVIAVLLVMTGLVPLWFVVCVVARDILILSGSFYIRTKKGIITQSNWPGKITFSCIAFVTLFSVLEGRVMEWLADAFLWTSVVLMVLSLILYAQRLFIGKGVLRKESD